MMMVVTVMAADLHLLRPYGQTPRDVNLELARWLRGYTFCTVRTSSASSVFP
jgi:hypothetical protein